MLVAGNYGYYRDELYFIADGRHLQAGYVDQPLLMGWLAALMRLIAGDGQIAIHVIPALAAGLIVLVTGLMARELGGGRVAQVIAGAAALFTVIFMAFGSLFSMDVLDQLFWSLACLVLVRILRDDASRLWILVGVILGVALLNKLTVLFFGLALGLALVVSPQRRHLLTPWPWLAAGIALLGLLPDVIWNAINGWPTWAFWHHYGRFGTSPLVFFFTQIVEMNPVAVPLGVAGLVYYFRRPGARYRLLGLTFVFLYVILTLLHVKGYFIAPLYPMLYASGAIVFERLHVWSWVRFAYVAVLATAAVLIAPDVMPILPPATLARDYPAYSEALADRFGWDTLARDTERVYAALPPEQRAQACVLTSNFGEASALQQLGAPGRLPAVISGQNNFYLWGPGRCTGKTLILVDMAPHAIRHARSIYSHIALAATHHCRYCVSFERSIPIYVLSGATTPIFPRTWGSLKSFR